MLCRGAQNFLLYPPSLPPPPIHISTPYEEDGTDKSHEVSIIVYLFYFRSASGFLPGNVIKVRESKPDICGISVTARAATSPSPAWPSTSSVVKEQSHKIFGLNYFSLIIFSGAPVNALSASAKFLNSRRYSQLKVHHRCHKKPASNYLRCLRQRSSKMTNNISFSSPTWHLVKCYTIVSNQNMKKKKHFV